MSIPTGDNAFLHELELDVRAELTLIEEQMRAQLARPVTSKARWRWRRSAMLVCMAGRSLPDDHDLDPMRFLTGRRVSARHCRRATARQPPAASAGPRLRRWSPRPRTRTRLPVGGFGPVALDAWNDSWKRPVKAP